MKKRALILLFMVMALLPSALALVQVDGPSRSIYNLGDKFSLSGYVQEDSDVTGFLKLAVKCNGNDFSFQMVPVSLKSGVQKTFQELSVPQITISASMGGQCYVELSVVSANKTYSSGVSKTFEVTKALEGSFLIEEPKVQFGDAVDITGTILRNDGSGVSGIAEIYFSVDGQNFLVDTAHFTDGLFNYTYITKAISPGAYSVDIVVRDVFGNVMPFLNAANFYLSNKLEVKVRADKAIVLPGENVGISGEITTVLNKAPEGLSAELALNEIKVPLALKDGIFKVEFKMPDNIKSGKHEITVSAADAAGNSGNYGVKVEVPQVASKIMIMTDKQSYLPKENLGVTAYLYDQGSDMINTLVTFEIFDPKGGRRTSTSIQTNQLEKFKVPDFAMPGSWKIAANIKSLSGEAKFEILPIKQIDAAIDGEALRINNVGNVKHTGNIEVLMQKGNEDFRALSRKSMQPNETVSIQLNKYAPNGNYIVTLHLPKDTSLAFDQAKEPLTVTIVNGRRVINLNIIFALFIAILIFVLLYMLLIKPSPRHKFEKISKYEHQSMGGKRTKRIFSAAKSPENSTAFDEVNDFKQRILHDIKQTEEKMSKPKGRRGEAGGSPFANMFG